MSTPRRFEEAIRETAKVFQEEGSQRKTALRMNMSRAAVAERLRHADEMGLLTTAAPKPFHVETELPSRLPSAEELISRRKAEFSRVDASRNARKLIDIAVTTHGPIGIAHGGDPHLDDPGTNIALIERHVDLVNRTEGLFAANVGDLQNGWIGRLARLYAEQSTSAAEAWVLVEWFVRSQQFLYLIKGNHDCWAGSGDPLNWMLRSSPGVVESDGARMNLKFPNRREVRINARHDFKGHSQWNPVHGPAKAAQMGWRDHILIAGHLHISGYNLLKDPSTGLISHAIRVASYKTHDRYADQLGLPDQNISECVVTVIDPDATDERRLVTVFMDPEEGADYLTFKRRRYEQGKRAA